MNTSSEPPGPFLRKFLTHHAIDIRAPHAQIVEQVARAFALIPYENLTKIIKDEHTGCAGRARRETREVLEDHLKFGAGGTCFSLTAALQEILAALGVASSPVLADRPYGDDTHCALRVTIDGRPHLIDPGYLILRPVLLEGGDDKIIDTGFNRIVLRPHKDNERIDLITDQQGTQRHRLTIKTVEADGDDFSKAWEASFDWDMMRYPLLTRIEDGTQLYLQGHRFQERTQDCVKRSFLTEIELVDAISIRFGIDRRLAGRALDILRRRGEPIGKAPTA